jgi:hypothetical protein
MTKQALITLRAKMLRKDSPWYAEDYANITRAVNRMTPRQLAESAAREYAIARVSQAEIIRNCQ